MTPQAQIRTATHEEIPGLFRPKVCVFRGAVEYRFDASTHELFDVREPRTLAPTHEGLLRAYRLPGGTVLRFEPASQIRWSINGAQIEERWPTPQQQQLVAGPYLVDVRPEDDALLFPVSGDRPALDLVLFGFFAATPPPRSLDAWLAS